MTKITVKEVDSPLRVAEDEAPFRFRSVRRPSLIAFACVAAMALAGCDKNQPRPTPPVPVLIKNLAAESITMSRRYSGSIEPLQTTSLAFKLSGTVQRLYRHPELDRDVQVGDTLEKGTVIAELDEGDLRRARIGAETRVAQLRARVQTAEETLAIATRNLERFDSSAGSISKVARDEVASRRVAAAGELETAEHALADALVQLDQAEDDYANRKLIVPFDHATVAEKHIEPGERTAAHQVAFRLIDISTVHVNFGVPDLMIGAPLIPSPSDERISLGQALTVSADAFEGLALKAKVTKIAPEADPTTRTFLIQLTLANHEVATGRPLLRPGMIVSVLVGANLDRKPTLLPMTAVHEGRSIDDLYVYEVVAENGRDVVRARGIAVGPVYDNQVEILPKNDDLRPGSRIAVTTSERLVDGAVVQVMDATRNAGSGLPEAQ